MPHFTYRAVNPRGRSIRGQLAAAHDLDLQQQLMNIGLTLIDARPVRQQRMNTFFSRRIKPRELIQLCIHLEQLQKSGVPILDGLADVRDSTENRALRDILTEVHRDIRDGAMLSAAFAKHPKAFGSLFVSLIAAGEKTGNLSSSFEQLTHHMKWVERLTARIKRATSYPMLLGLLMSGVLVFMMGYVVPQIVEFLRSMDIALPLATRALIAVSATVQNSWPVVLSVLVFGALGVRLLRQVSEAFAYKVDSWILRLPLFGTVIKKINLSRYCHTFAVMFNSGLEILDCLDAAAKTVSNRCLIEALTILRQQVQAGNTLSTALQTTGEFPNMVVRMLKIGEESGNLSTVLSQVSEIYDRDVDDTVQAMIGSLEPALTIVMGIIMGWIALAVFGPIYDSLGKIQ